MKTIGKAMKIANNSKVSEADALQKALSTYRQMPHPSTGIPPASALFRDGIKQGFPRKSASDREVEESRRLDSSKKVDLQETMNSSRYRQASAFEPDDIVLVRNSTRKSKYLPTFLPDPFIVVEVDPTTKKITLESLKDERMLTRHPDDIKTYYGPTGTPPNVCQHDDARVSLQADEVLAQKSLLDDDFQESVPLGSSALQQSMTDPSFSQVPVPEVSPTGTRRSDRVSEVPKRYIEEC